MASEDASKRQPRVTGATPSALEELAKEEATNWQLPGILPQTAVRGASPAETELSPPDLYGRGISAEDARLADAQIQLLRTRRIAGERLLFLSGVVGFSLLVFAYLVLIHGGGTVNVEHFIEPDALLAEGSDEHPHLAVVIPEWPDDGEPYYRRVPAAWTEFGTIAYGLTLLSRGMLIAMVGIVFTQLLKTSQELLSPVDFSASKKGKAGEPAAKSVADKLMPELEPLLEAAEKFKSALKP